MNNGMVLVEPELDQPQEQVLHWEELNFWKTSGSVVTSFILQTGQSNCAHLFVAIHSVLPATLPVQPTCSKICSSQTPHWNQAVDKKSAPISLNVKSHSKFHWRISVDSFGPDSLNKINNDSLSTFLF